MPERRLERARRSLPEGYRFGDAGIADSTLGISIRFVRQFDADEERRQSLSFSAAEVIRWRQSMERAAHGWNAIESEEHGDEWAV